MQMQKQVIDTARIPTDLHAPIKAICREAIMLSARIARGALGGAMGADVGQNSDGDRQKALDVIADDRFVAALQGTGIRWYASEERETVLEIDAGGRFALAIDPLDGSSNIDVNVSIGTIFSIYEARADAEESFLRPASEQIAAGYVIYGPQTCLVITFGAGTMQFTLDPACGAFVLSHPALRLPLDSHEYAINASNYRHWPAAVRAFVDDCLAGTDGPGGADFNMRWIASLVAETHRILTRGGVFLYPGDGRPGYGRGRLRMLYECAPIAMLVEQAGGRATDGAAAILAQRSHALHARTPFVFGSARKVERVSEYHDLPEQEVSALFGSRGLFRV